MAKPVSPSRFWLISVAVFVAMVVVTVVVFVAVQRAAHHLPGAHPDLRPGDGNERPATTPEG